jgi:flagellar M-ring protein FliF
MEFLNNAFAQVADLFRSMTPGARLLSALMLAVVVVSLGWLFTFEGTTPELDLMNGVPVNPSYIPPMQEAFADAGLNSYEIQGGHIKIPRGQRDLYMAALAEHNALPPNIETVFDDALKEVSVFMPAEERKARMRIAKQKTLGLIISQMTGIESASVIYDEQNEGHRFSPVKKITATAAIKPSGGETLREQQVRGIRALVAGSIAGLKAEDVTVSDLNGQTWHADAQGGSPLEDPYGARKRMYEQEWEAKILQALRYVPGVSVTPNVELDRQRRSRQWTVRHDPKPVVVSEQEDSLSRVHEGAAPGGRPGYASQQSNTPAQLTSSRKLGSHEEMEESSRRTQALASGSQEDVESVGLTPVRVTVAVSVPTSYFRKVWGEQNPPEEGADPVVPDKTELNNVIDQESTKIQRLVANLLPAPPGVDDRTQLVEVVTFQDIKTAPLPEPATADQALAWLAGNWTTLGMFLAAGVSLLILRAMLRAEPTTAVKTSGGSVLHEGDPAEAEAAAEVANRLARFNTTGRSLRDELSELVSEDTDAAANILKTWIGTAG